MISAILKKKFRSKLRKLERSLPNFSLDTYDTSEDILGGLERFIELESLSWKGGGVGVSRSQHHLAFYRELLPVLASLNRVAIKLLRNDDDLVAGELVYKLRNSIFFAHTAYNKEYAKLSPGTLVTGLTVKDYLGKNYTVGDFLCGYADYLNPWCSEIIRTSMILIVPRSIYMNALVRAWKLRRWALATTMTISERARDLAGLLRSAAQQGGRPSWITGKGVRRPPVRRRSGRAGLRRW